jgi:hypothetical protein
MGESVSTGSRTEYLARKETRALRNVVLKALRIWDKALLEGECDPRLEENVRYVEKQASAVKTGEA